MGYRNPCVLPVPAFTGDSHQKGMSCVEVGTGEPKSVFSDNHILGPVNKQCLWTSASCHGFVSLGKIPISEISGSHIGCQITFWRLGQFIPPLTVVKVLLPPLPPVTTMAFHKSFFTFANLIGWKCHHYFISHLIISDIKHFFMFIGYISSAKHLFIYFAHLKNTVYLFFYFF